MKTSREGREPVYRGTARVRMLDQSFKPEVLFGALADRAGSIFLDSAMIDRYGLGRWSFIMWDPLFSLSSRADTVAFKIGTRLRWEQANPFAALRRTLALFSIQSDPSWIPFRGGAAGFFGYELGGHIERLPQRALFDLHLPDCYLGFYDSVLAFDHIMEQWFICHVDFGLRRPSLLDRVRQIRELVETGEDLAKTVTPVETGEPESNFTRADYLAAVGRAKEYIEAGDIYQVNLSQRFSAPLVSGSPWDLYLRLRQTNPAPFASFVQAGEFQILSSSPERFLAVRGDRVETRPIKGTRPRGTNAREDAYYKAQLLASQKDRAELNMIVDLERNDLGRVCRYGSVTVPRHAQCETYARVHHLVSTVEGTVRPDRDATDLLLATFPGGSITGAPKIRSMEIIDELEPHARGVYTGSIGYIGYDGDLDLNIAIRTMVCNGGRAYFSAGGGIVYDSDPASEFEETFDKASALIEALGSRSSGF